MGVIAKQSGFAAIALGAGMVFGALNNIVVLPRAFEGNEVIWGLVRIMTSWGMICAAISTLGAPGAILRFLHRYDEVEREKSLNSILAIAAFGVLATLTILWKWGESWIVWLDPDKGELLSQNVHWFLVIVAIMSALHIFRAWLTWKLRTAFIAWVDELWQKTSYFTLGTLLLFDWVSIQAFVPLYIASYGVSFLLMGSASLGMFSGLHKGFNRIDLPRFAEFSAFSLFSGAAVIIATQLDYIMVGKFLGLEEVPVYTLGFFMGSVVALPQRATSSIIRGIVAEKINRDDNSSIGQLSKNSARVNFLLMGALTAGIWAGFDPLQQLLPPKYRGLELVFLCIAGAQLISGLNVSNNSHLGYSEHYRITLPVNLALIVVTAAMNYLFLVVFKWGLAGAALATLGTFVWNN
ncbi:MAG TPA: hypothetical protein DD635_03150, partial [Flavobacteriales bacterium]|nr:hypothetical protein [Flavobacteriales bacterium]